MKRTGPSNEHVVRLIQELNRTSAKEGAPLWKRVADDLSLPRRNARAVNLSRLHFVLDANAVVVVPGKVLGTGMVPQGLTIAAVGFSKSAHEKITQAKGKCISIEQLAKDNPKGTNVRLIG